LIISGTCCKGIFSSLPRQTESGAHPTSYLVVTGAISPWVMRPGREADLSPPCNADFRSVWSYTSTSTNVFIAWYSVKNRKNFTFSASYLFYVFFFFLSLFISSLFAIFLSFSLSSFFAYFFCIYFSFFQSVCTSINSDKNS